MPNYPGKRKGTRRIVVWAKLPGEAKSRPREWVVRGTRTQGDAFEARKRLELGQRQTEFRTAPSFEVFCVEQYRPHAKAHLKESTWKKVRRYQIETLCRFVGPMTLSDFTVLTVDRLKTSLLEQMVASSVNNHLRVLRTILNYARAIGVPVPDVRWKKLPVRGRGRVFVWTDEDVQKIFRAAAKVAPDLVPILAFLLNTGCRKGEALVAERAWIDRPARMLRIPSNPYWQPKSDKAREVPIGAALETLLRRPPAHPRWLFPSRLGDRYQDFPKEPFWAVLAHARVKGVPHTTRHTYASHFLKRVPDLFLLAQVLGHSHQRVTELYSHLLPDHLSRARDAVHLMPDHGRYRGTNVVSMRNHRKRH